MAVANLSMHPAHVWTPEGAHCRARLTVRGGKLTVTDRRTRVLFTADVASWQRADRVTVLTLADGSTIEARAATSCCGGGPKCP